MDAPSPMRMGYFTVPKLAYATMNLNSGYARSLMKLFGKVIILHMQHEEDRDAVCYFAVSPLFRILDTGEPAPTYHLRTEVRDNGPNYLYPHRYEEVIVGFIEVEEAFDIGPVQPEHWDLNKCPKCGGPADRGHDRHDPPSPYVCSKCEPDEPEEEKQ